MPRFLVYYSRCAGRREQAISSRKSRLGQNVAAAKGNHINHNDINRNHLDGIVPNKAVVYLLTVQQQRGVDGTCIGQEGHVGAQAQRRGGNRCADPGVQLHLAYKRHDGRVAQQGKGGAVADVGDDGDNNSKEKQQQRQRHIAEYGFKQGDDPVANAQISGSHGIAQEGEAANDAHHIPQGAFTQQLHGVGQRLAVYFDKPQNAQRQQENEGSADRSQNSASGEVLRQQRDHDDIQEGQAEDGENELLALIKFLGNVAQRLYIFNIQLLQRGNIALKYTGDHKGQDAQPYQIDQDAHEHIGEHIDAQSKALHAGIDKGVNGKGNALEGEAEITHAAQVDAQQHEFAESVLLIIAAHIPDGLINAEVQQRGGDKPDEHGNDKAGEEQREQQRDRASSKRLDAKQLAHQHIDHAGFLERHAQRRYKDQLGDGRTAHPTGNSGGGCQKAAVYHGDNTQDSS